VPFLHRIPLLGWLFRRDEIQDESRELLIFITPRILRG
jgi:type IV pilus assembly protein PilQ